jgi:hypothetical protein
MLPTVEYSTNATGCKTVMVNFIETPQWCIPPTLQVAKTGDSSMSADCPKIKPLVASPQQMNPKRHMPPTKKSLKCKNPQG